MTENPKAYAESGQTRPARALDRKFWPEGHLAQCFVADSTQLYRRLLAKYRSGDTGTEANMRETAALVPGGIMVPFTWLRL